MQSIELFTGSGGLALGTHQAGFEHQALVEWNRDACDTLRFNIARQSKRQQGMAQWSVHQADIKDLISTGFFNQFKNGNIRLLAGGVPCQPFSLGGKHKAHRDDRDLFPDFVGVVQTIRPQAFIVENVKGLLRQSFATYFEYIRLRLTYPDVLIGENEQWRDHLERLEDVHTSGVYDGLKYNVIAQLLNAADFGVPQTRERVFIVGFRSDLGIDWHFPKPTHSREALLYDQWVTGEYWHRHRMNRPDPVDIPITLSSSVLKQLQHRGIPPGLRPWETIRDTFFDLPEPALKENPSFPNHVLKVGAKTYPGHTGSPLDLPSKTLKAGVHGVPGGENMLVRLDGSVRYFTVRESARLQTFPDNWIFSGAWSEAMRQLGNAVPVTLAKVVAESVAEKLKGCCSG